MSIAAVLFALPVEASVFLKSLSDLRITGEGLYEGCVRGSSIRVGVSGMGGERSALKARCLLSGGADMLVVCGFAAGLDGKLIPGDVVVASSVLHELTEPPTSLACDQGLTRLASHVCGREPQMMACVTDVVHSPAEKAALAVRLGCVTADMESRAAVLVANEFDVPAVVVRAVVDDSGDTMPREFSRAVKPNGSLQLGRLAAEIVRRPRLLGTMPAMAVRSRRCARNFADFLGEFLPRAMQTAR
jgi:adenosylhomocysteine nucleosidase